MTNPAPSAAEEAHHRSIHCFTPPRCGLCRRVRLGPPWSPTDCWAAAECCASRTCEHGRNLLRRPARQHLVVAPSTKRRSLAHGRIFVASSSARGRRRPGSPARHLRQLPAAEVLRLTTQQFRLWVLRWAGALGGGYGRMGFGDQRGTTAEADPRPPPGPRRRDRPSQRRNAASLARPDHGQLSRHRFAVLRSADRWPGPGDHAGVAYTQVAIPADSTTSPKCVRRRSGGGLEAQALSWRPDAAQQRSGAGPALGRQVERSGSWRTRRRPRRCLAKPRRRLALVARSRRPAGQRSLAVEHGAVRRQCPYIADFAAAASAQAVDVIGHRDQQGSHRDTHQIPGQPVPPPASRTSVSPSCPAIFRASRSTSPCPRSSASQFISASGTQRDVHRRVRSDPGSAARHVTVSPARVCLLPHVQQRQLTRRGIRQEHGSACPRIPRIPRRLDASPSAIRHRDR